MTSYRNAAAAERDPSVFPCSGCRAVGPDCCNECRDMDAYKAHWNRVHINQLEQAGKEAGCK